MKPTTRWLALLATAAIVGVGFGPASAWLAVGLQARLNGPYQEQIASLPEQQAVIFVRRLSRDHGSWLELLVAASADERPAVAAAAAAELRDVVDRWAKLTPQDRSPPVAELAHLLAQQAPMLPAERRHLAHSLAQRLIDWPVDGRLVDPAQLIDDCRSVLVLLRTEPADIRMAAVARPSMNSAETSGEPSDVPAPANSPMPETELPPVIAAPTAPPIISQPGSTLQPNRTEPGPFKPGGAQRISDDGSFSR